MSDETKKTTNEMPLQPVSVTVIGTGSVSGGPAPMQSGTVATTPAEHQPNLLIKVITPLTALGVRFANAYFTTLVGIVTAGMTPYGSQIMPTHDFADLLTKSALLAISGPTVALLKDLVTIFGRLENKFPLLTGNV